MNVKRILALGIAGGAVAAWWAAASTPARRQGTDTFVGKTTPVEMRGAELATEIARLRERLHPTIAPQTPSRNLFEFSARPSSRAASTAPVEVVPPIEMANPVVTPPLLKLVGIAEDTGPDGAVRTAIISGAGGRLFFAKAGDRVGDRFEIAKVSSEAAEITDLADHSSFTLILK